MRLLRDKGTVATARRPLTVGAGKAGAQAKGTGLDVLNDVLASADAILVGAGAGLSTSSGLAYSGERFERNFGPWIERYGFSDMYSGGFYPFPTAEETWGYWARMIWCNRYEREVGPAYERLLDLVEGKDHFVITTNVDHCFQDAGFDKGRLFYTQGDYGLWQCSKPCHAKTYDNYEVVSLMERWLEDHPGTLRVPSALVPRCPRCGEPMAMNLRCDETFVEDAGWHAAAGRYSDWLRGHEGGRVVYLELGVGANTPGIIKYPFWRRTYQNPDAVYVCLNLGEAMAPREIRGRSICVNGDIAQVLGDLVGE